MIRVYLQANLSLTLSSLDSITTDTSACTGIPSTVHVLLLWDIDQV